MTLKPSDLVKPVLGTALVSAVGLWGCSNILDTPGITFQPVSIPKALTALPVSNSKPVSIIKENFSNSALPDQKTTPSLEPVQSGSEITVEEYLTTATVEEIKRVEQENGITFSVLIEKEKAQDRNFSQSFNFKSKEPELTPTIRKPHTAAKHNGRWFDDMDMEESFRFTEKVTGEPASLQRKIAHIESKGDIKAINKDTLACGHEQLMPATLREMAKKYGEKAGFKELADSIDKVVIGHDKKGRAIITYKAKPGKGAYIAEQCHVPWINSILTSMNRIEKMNRIDNALAEKGYPAFSYMQSDIYISHFLGARPDIILARETYPELPSVKFASRIVVSQNPGMFYDQAGNKRAIRQTFEHIHSNGEGPSYKVSVQPYWRTSQEVYEARMAKVIAHLTADTTTQLAETPRSSKLASGQTIQLLMK